MSKMENESEQKRPSMLMIGEKVPDFEAVTTHGTIRLSDFKGKWIVLFSYTADFTPVDTSELIAFAKIYGDLLKRNVQLIGLSTDTIHSHIAFIWRIKEKWGVEIPFPIIADVDTTIAYSLGMIHPTASGMFERNPSIAIKAVLFIDPEMTLRAIIYYPFMLGRNTDEIIRVIDALQAHEKYKVSFPANWRPGDDVLLTPPRTFEEAEKRLQEGYECVDWFYCKKKLP